jgi:hypothetical protein
MLLYTYPNHLTSFGSGVHQLRPVHNHKLNNMATLGDAYVGLYAEKATSIHPFRVESLQQLHGRRKKGILRRSEANSQFRNPILIPGPTHNCLSSFWMVSPFQISHNSMGINYAHTNPVWITIRQGSRVICDSPFQKKHFYRPFDVTLKRPSDYGTRWQLDTAAPHSTKSEADVLSYCLRSLALAAWEAWGRVIPSAKKGPRKQAFDPTRE